MNWAAGLNPPAECFQHFVSLFDAEVKKFVQSANSSGDSITAADIASTVSVPIAHLQNQLKEYNNELGKWKDLASKLPNKLSEVKAKFESGHAIYGPYKIPQNIDVTQLVDVTLDPYQPE